LFWRYFRAGEILIKLDTKIAGRNYQFAEIKHVLAQANEEKSGDQLAQIGSQSEIERIAAKSVLSQLPLSALREQPVVAYDLDEVTRLIDDSLDPIAYAQIKDWTVAELREFLLDSDTDLKMIEAIRWGLSGEMVAAVTKLMSNIDLILAGKKCQVVVKAKTTLGLSGRLSSRLQPNHPSDSIDGIKASIFEGLSYGVGDAVIGINPVYDSADTVGRLLEETHKIIDQLKIPTQNCILSHITTQMKAIERGAPAGLIFQSIAGSEKGNKAFGIDLDLIREACALGKKEISSQLPFMYFETGQGSELSSLSHFGADQLTMEARCYALARCFNPFLVNDVVGFIGPEYLADGRQMIRAGLEDHFMAKLLGLPMGVDACYTNHMDADQNDLENLTILLTAAGVNYFMGVPMGDDVMLSYQSTSFHDIAALREIHQLLPAPEFEVWLQSVDLLKDGKLTKNAGDPSYLPKRFSL